MRGIDGSGPNVGANAFLSGTRPRLNLSLDGRSLTYNEQAFGPQSLWDLDRVEVFLGPQSYIQGRNAIAGAIVMASKDPTFEWESAFKAAPATNTLRNWPPWRPARWWKISWRSA
ncbi:TonB-dependent receptor plug domain-containing protein [Serratia ureilytica]